MNPAYPDHPLLGIDVSKATFDACLLLPDGTKHEHPFANTPEGFTELDAWLRKHRAPRTLAGLEATGPYGALLLWHLHQRSHRVSQLNPRRIKDYARSQGRRVKTDRTDAHLIACYLRSTEEFVLWEPPSEALSQLQALIRRRQALLDHLQAERNRLQATRAPTVQASVQRLIKHLQNEVKTIDTELDLHLLAHNSLQQSVRLLRSIDGIGRLVAMTILAEVPMLSSFERARDLAAFAGLTPSLCQSGTSVRRRGRMTKEGSSLLRKMLYMAAIQAVKRSSNAFHQSYMDMVKRGKAKMCAIGALMHKLIRIAFGVLKHQTPFVNNFAKLHTAS